ncbi:MAG: hypothetical protein QHJ34_02425 [bacterium]|nr:hypothetical protein [candidate division KSB1 bacterium]MDH7559074.1 hypothetical protein [bacterium]
MGLRRIAGVCLTLWALTLPFARRASAQAVTVTSGLFSDVRTFYLADLDLTRSGGGMPIFWIELRNTSSAAQQVYIRLQLESHDFGVLAWGKTDTFTLGPAEVRRLDNQNLVQEGGRYSFVEYDWNHQLAAELQDYVFAHGKLRPDLYALTIEVYDAGSASMLDDASLTLDITNPSTLDLVAPGARVEGEDLPLVYSIWPVFLWESDIDLFHLVVAEKPVDVHVPIDASPEQILQDQVRLSKYLRVHRGPGAPPPSSGDILVVPSTFFQYPETGVLPLQEGRTYFWRLTGIVPTSGTTAEMESEIWGFKVAPLSAGDTSPEHLQLLAQLRSLLGDEALEALFAAGGPLHGCVFTGVVQDGEGRAMTLAELVSLVTQLRQSGTELSFEVLEQ